MKEVDGVRLLGMLYILVSFIPWIVYWILCGFGNPLGITASLIISIVLILPQILKRSFNLMDLVSLIYFSLAFISTFILNFKHIFGK
jgi:all-trans-retinol 13,14-reductase